MALIRENQRVLDAYLGPASTSPLAESKVAGTSIPAATYPQSSKPVAKPERAANSPELTTASSPELTKSTKNFAQNPSRFKLDANPV